MAQRPTVDDLRTFLGLPEPSFGDPIISMLTEAFDASIELIESRINLPDGSDDDDGYPATVRSAVLIQANRLYKRRTSPEGVAGFGDAGVVRIASIDADVEPLISRFLKLDGFA